MPRLLRSRFKLALIACHLGLSRSRNGSSEFPLSRPPVVLSILLVAAALPPSSSSSDVVFAFAAAGATAAEDGVERSAATVAVPSSNDDDLREDGDAAVRFSPPSGPLPDPPGIVARSAADDYNGAGAGACDEERRRQRTDDDDAVGDCDSSTRSSSPPPSASLSAASPRPSGKEYCAREHVANDDYDHFDNTVNGCVQDDPHRPAGDPSSMAGDFVLPHVLPPGRVAPILWRDGGKIVSQHAIQVGLPPALVSSLLEYAEEQGVVEAMRGYTSSRPLPPQEHVRGEFVPSSDGRHSAWYAQRPAEKWKSDMHWMSPANERTHEDFLRALGRGGFDEVLEGIGEALSLDGLVAYHLTFIGVGHSTEGFRHHDSKDTNGGVYNVIIPLLLEEDVPPELILWDDEHPEWRGGYKYQIGAGVAMGDGAIHGTFECDYRDHPGPLHGGLDETGKRVGMRLAATVYVAEVYSENARAVADQTLTQIFPPNDPDWLLAQEARHWQAEGSGYPHANKLVGDVGRKAFRKDDAADDCEERAEAGECESDVEGTRKECPFSCLVYLREGPASVRVADNGGRGVEVCSANRTGIEECRTYKDDSAVAGDFVTPNLAPGEMFPFVWRSDLKRATEFAFLIGVPPELTEALTQYADWLGVTDLMRKYTSSGPIPPTETTSSRFVELSDGNRWYAQRPAKKWQSNMHWISPADEATHEEYLEVLGLGNFDAVLNAVGTRLGLEGLAAYHLTFIGVSHSERGFMHRDTHHTGGSVYNVIVPLTLGENAAPELRMTDWDDESRAGALKYEVGTAAMMGDDAMHGTEACDYRASGGMRLAATIYVADINEENSSKIAKQTLTQIFPLPDAAWLKAQAGRHWVADWDVGGVESPSLANDAGRKHFSFRDSLSDCAARAVAGMCLTDKKITRRKCLRSCKIYESNGYDEEEVVEGPPELEFDFETYEAGQLINAFFENLNEDDQDSCIDEENVCKEKAERGLCMTNPVEMEILGCNRSCMYCLTPSSRDIFSLGIDQVMEEDESGDEASEEEDPASQYAVTEIIARMENYFVNEVLRYDDLRVYRRSCRNKNKHCAVWAAEGYCESSPGPMGKACSAVCRKCPMADRKVRCPTDKRSNVFQPGGINAMFERWLQEAGQDTTLFSKENLPTGGTHKFGELSVITSPYQDVMQFLDEEDEEEDPETVSPVPWLVTIDGFLSDKECDRFIELGDTMGYARSSQYATNADGSAKIVESDDRTSSNAFCEKGCYDDPIVAGAIERMAKMTSIPYANFEPLQIVKYEEGQFYKNHHDFSSQHVDYPYGPRMLTFFLYLNDVEEGGGTKFKYMNYTAQPKRGMALVWPSMTDDLEEMDDWTWHEALPVLKGKKYGTNSWIHLGDFQNCPHYC